MAETQVEPPPFDHVYGRMLARAKGGKRCRVLLHGSSGHAVQIQFEDGTKMIAPTRSVSKEKKK